MTTAIDGPYYQIDDMRYHAADVAALAGEIGALAEEWTAMAAQPVDHAAAAAEAAGTTVRVRDLLLKVSDAMRGKGEMPASAVLMAAREPLIKLRDDCLHSDRLDTALVLSVAVGLLHHAAHTDREGTAA